MDAQELDVEAITETLKRFAGKGHLHAHGITAYGSLAELPQVMSNIYRADSLEERKGAIESAITSAIAEFKERCEVYKGRNEKIPVSAKNLRRALTLVFNLQKGPKFRGAWKRRRAVIGALGLGCGVDTYRREGPERHLMYILASKIIEMANNEQASNPTYTQLLEVTLLFRKKTEIEAEGRPPRTTLYRIEVDRTIVALINKCSWTVEDQDCLAGDWSREAMYEPVSECLIDPPLPRPANQLGFARSKLIIRFPEMQREATRRLSYAVDALHPEVAMRAPHYQSQPSDRCGKVIVRLVFPSGHEPVWVWGYRELREDQIEWDVSKFGTRIRPNKPSTYTFEVPNPTPYLFFGVDWSGSAAEREAQEKYHKNVTEMYFEAKNEQRRKFEMRESHSD